ncbi:unnamed protein product [Candida verbasci]|uniref:Coatomer subunit epsilon n=1 Tax=Candida verbasci TaxID=1227364 RepID=A0A9W4XF47_9ASCO|nr:unnamed protein product [Candida verbasci]
MDIFSDSGELYTIRNQFHTYQHNKVIQYDLNSFSPDVQLKVLEYQIRSTIALEQDASNLIENGKSLFPDSEELFQLLSAWNDLKDFGTDDSTYFEDIKEGKFELQAILTTLYLIKFEKDIDQAIVFLSSYINSVNTLKKYNELEPFLILIQLYLIKGNLKMAINIFENLKKDFPDSARDSTIYQVFESWILSIKNETDNINNSYYFYDEILASDFGDDSEPKGKFKILNVLLVLTLQLRHVPEAQELIEQMKSLNVVDDNFIANQITLKNILGDDTNDLISQLRKLNPEHDLIKDLDAKELIFDEIATKYKSV